MLAQILTTIVMTHPITPLHTYNGLDNGIVVDINLEEEVDKARLVLFDYKNNQLALSATVTNGIHDLTSRIPEIKKQKQAVWVQLFVHGEAVHSPLVVQPMTSRKVPVIEEALRPDGETKYSKIVGWEDEADEDGMDTPFVSGWRVYLDQDAIIETSEGDIRISFRPDTAPNTVWNFRELALGGFYQNTSFHRIVPMTSKGHPFVIQGGDPTGTGSGGPGFWLPIEESTLPHDFGVISMARAGDPDSAGSQFFFCLSREGTARLDGQYCSFGETIEGEEVIRKIAATPLSNPASGKPVNPPQIKRVTLVFAEPKS
ncbi:MAG: peptidylprolyl isomerase [Phycisphaerales bacterium]|jgi:peptidyl-prolyl cis-trans isomerase B (cyclophilin B)|nr:peptidylprolyl isomerase [Phycisphaerales bacterium]